MANRPHAPLWSGATSLLTLILRNDFVETRPRHFN
jgi:hypothetical protein